MFYALKETVFSRFVANCKWMFCEWVSRGEAKLT